MPSVMLPEKCLNDPGRGKSWLLTAIAHFGGQEAIDDADTAIKTAGLKGVTWKQQLSVAFPMLSGLFAGKTDVLEIAEAINAIPAPVQTVQVQSDD